MATQKTEIGERIEQMLKVRGFDQIELAKRCGTTQSTISKIITGTIKKSRKLYDIAQELEVSVQWLLHGDDNNQNSREILKGDMRINPNDFILIRMYSDRSVYETEPKTSEEDIEDNALMLDKKLLPANTTADDVEYYIVTDSAMAKTITEGARVCFLTNNKVINNGKAYAIQYGVLTQIRYLYQQHDGSIIVKAENSDEFEDYKVPREHIESGEFKVLGKVLTVTTIW
ncbi:XRE family transcriptional regulator [Acinetobacter soli]|uniref:HTH cro/C1-type domain-containing protein n=1 Tax=Acinetobacter soli TaxID=487316 RepID=A0A1P8END7_9GAMM|nr:helix-turn-helix domain-containing protein [Acinetobacter soli]APV37689.1 hypothetical protein BEN76_16695 [Acinetobacter soli]